MDYDVAIVGLGPAGSTLARYLDPGLRVIAVDKKLPEGGFEKPCGGLLAPDAQKSLSRFNLTLPKDLLVDPQIFSVRTIDLRTGLTRYYQRHYMNLDRRKFDRWLISLIPDSVEVMEGGQCAKIEPCGEGYRLSGYTPTGPFSLTTRVVVGADGANSVVRRAVFPHKKIRTYLCIQQVFRDHHPAPLYSCVFDPSLTDCYTWGLTKDDRFLFGGAFPVDTAKEALVTLKEKLVPHGFRLEHPLETQACMTLRPSGPLSFCQGRDQVLLIGEAAGYISPSSLEGISYAMDSGYLLSQAINKRPEEPGPGYRRKILGLQAKLVRKTFKSPFLYQPLLREMVMRSGMNSISVLGD